MERVDGEKLSTSFFKFSSVEAIFEAAKKLRFVERGGHSSENSNIVYLVDKKKS